mmetsp:Transcript_19606/g.75228  ORF Transcript_19606/g.75228 Transcript_19606/m.75228 type:complete len:555 (-) Transcript_19606:722-2386(-)
MLVPLALLGRSGQLRLRWPHGIRERVQARPSHLFKRLGAEVVAPAPPSAGFCAIGFTPVLALLLVAFLVAAVAVVGHDHAHSDPAEPDRARPDAAALVGHREVAEWGGRRAPCEEACSARLSIVLVLVLKACGDGPPLAPGSVPLCRHGPARGALRKHLSEGQPKRLQVASDIGFHPRQHLQVSDGVHPPPTWPGDVPAACAAVHGRVLNQRVAPRALPLVASSRATAGRCAVDGRGGPGLRRRGHGVLRGSTGLAPLLPDLRAAACSAFRVDMNIALRHSGSPGRGVAGDCFRHSCAVRRRRRWRFAGLLFGNSVGVCTCRCQRGSAVTVVDCVGRSGLCQAGKRRFRPFLAVAGLRTGLACGLLTCFCIVALQRAAQASESRNGRRGRVRLRWRCNGGGRSKAVLAGSTSRSASVDDFASPQPSRARGLQGRPGASKLLLGCVRTSKGIWLCSRRGAGRLDGLVRRLRRGRRGSGTCRLHTQRLGLGWRCRRVLALVLVRVLCGLGHALFELGVLLKSGVGIEAASSCQSLGRNRDGLPGVLRADQSAACYR